MYNIIPSLGPGSEDEGLDSRIIRDGDTVALSASASAECLVGRS